MARKQELQVDCELREAVRYSLGICSEPLLTSLHIDPLQDGADTCRRKMKSASALIGGLGGEKVRWTLQAKEFNEQVRRLVGDVLVMCAFMSYWYVVAFAKRSEDPKHSHHMVIHSPTPHIPSPWCSGPFNAEFRTILVNGWRDRLDRMGIPYTKGLDLVSSLADGPTVGQWGLEGLPNDELSLQNGIIVTKARLQISYTYQRMQVLPHKCDCLSRQHIYAADLIPKQCPGTWLGLGDAVPAAD